MVTLKKKQTSSELLSGDDRQNSGKEHAYDRDLNSRVVFRNHEDERRYWREKEIEFLIAKAHHPTPEELLGKGAHQAKGLRFFLKKMYHRIMREL